MHEAGAGSAVLSAMNRGDRWTAAAGTGGPVNEVFDQLRERVPGLAIEHLQVTRPANDNNVYFIGDQHRLDRIQIDTPPSGRTALPHRERWPAPDLRPRRGSDDHLRLAEARPPSRQHRIGQSAERGSPGTPAVS